MQGGIFEREKIPLNMRYQVLLARRDHNYQAFTVASIIAFTIAVIYVLQQVYLPGDHPFPWIGTAYIILFSALAAGSALFFLVYHWLHERVPLRFESIIVYGYAFFMVLVTTFLTNIDLIYNREYTGMFVGLITVCVILSAPAMLYTALASVSLILFSMGHFILFPGQGLDSFLPGLVNAAVSAAIGAIIQGGRTHNEVLKLHLQDLNRELREYSFRDPLTGARNRRFLMEYLEQQRLFELRHAMGLCIIILDIDHFKRVNDTLGHPVGDVVLKDLANVGQGCLRDSDMLARYGGEEFIAVLPKTNLQDAMMVAERLRAGVEFHTFAGVPWTVTASFGVAEMRKDESIESLISRADIALYWSKKEGRNRVSRSGEHGAESESFE